MLTDFIVSLSPIAIPLIIGFTITGRIFFGWVIGALLVYLLILFLYSVNLFFNIEIPFSIQFSLLIINIFALCIFYLVIKSNSIFNRFHQKQLGTLADLFFLLILSGAIFFLIWKNATPYPLNVNWDIYEHITVANKISESSVSFLPSKISDTFTFDGYSTFFHSLIALPKLLFNRDLLGSYWWLEYWFYFFSTTAGYLFVHKITKSRMLAISAGILGSLVFESSIVFSNLFLLPQTLVAILTIFLLIEVINLDIKKHKPQLINLILIALTCITILLTHFVIGAFGIFIILLYVLLSMINKIKNLNYALIFSFLVLIIAGLANLSPGIVLTSREEAAHFILDYKQLSSLFLSWFGLISLILFTLGSIYILLTKDKEKKIVLIMALIGLSISIAPISYFLKFFVVDRYFIIIILTISIGLLIHNLNRVIQLVMLSIIFLAYFGTFYLNQFQYKQPLYYDSFQSQISFGEIEAAEWIKRNYGADTIIVSDPATQYIAEAISGINSQGGAYSNENTRRALINLYENKNTEEAVKQLTTIQDNLKNERNNQKRILFILSGRYFDWQRMSNEEKLSVFYNVWQPKAILNKDLPFLNSLSSASKFKVVYTNKELTILEVVNE